MAFNIFGEFYPTVDQTTHWMVGSFSNRVIRDVWKNVSTSSTSTVIYKAFNTVTFVKMSKGSINYTLSPVGEASAIGGIGDLKYCWGRYSLVGTSYTYDANLELYTNGKFIMYGAWSNPPPDYATGNYKLVVEFDYALGPLVGKPGLKDICEYTKFFGVNPSVHPEACTYTWVASSTSPTTVSYGATPDFYTGASGALERTLFFRAANCIDPQSQTFIVLGPIWCPSNQMMTC